MKVAEIQRFCMHDGPGIRTVVFAKGCPLRCEWCHNPETWEKASTLLFYPAKCISCGACLSCAHQVHGFSAYHTLQRENCIRCGGCASRCPTGALELCGRDLSREELLREIARDQAFYTNGGGVTFSGGEPFTWGEELIDLLAECKRMGISTAVETCGYTSRELLRQAVPHTDLFLWDVKHTDSAEHQKRTGVPLEPILENLHLADSMGASIRLRCILLSGINANPKHYGNLRQLASELRNCEGVEFLPYHAYGSAKAEAAGISQTAHAEWIPTAQQLSEAREAVLPKD